MNYVHNYKRFTPNFSKEVYNAKPEFYINQLAIFTIVVASIFIIFNKNKIANILSTISLSFILYPLIEFLGYSALESDGIYQYGKQHIYILIIFTLLLFVEIILINQSKKGKELSKKTGTKITLSILALIILGLSNVNFLAY